MITTEPVKHRAKPKNLGRLPDFATIKQAAKGHWLHIGPALSGVPSEFFDGRKRPCPKCGGRDRARAFDDFNQEGGVVCSHCHNKRNADGFSTLQWLNGWSFPDTVRAVAEQLGLAAPSGPRPAPQAISFAPQQPKPKAEKPHPESQLEFQEWSPELALMWCMKKEPIKPEALKLFGARIAKYQGKFVVMALPISGESLDAAAPVGWIIYNITGATLPSKDGPVSKKITWGSDTGVVGMVDRLKDRSSRKIKTEGPTDALALLSLNLDTTDAIFCNACGAIENPDKEQFKFLPSLAEQSLFVSIGDADKAGEEGVAKWANFFAATAAESRIARLNYEVIPSHGKDLRNWIAEGNTLEDFENLVAAGEVVQYRRVERTAELSKPQIVLGHECSQIVYAVESLLGRLRDEKAIFQRGGQLVEVVAEPLPLALPGNILLPAGAPRIRQLPIQQLFLRIMDCCRLMTERGDGELISAMAPKWLVEGIYSHGAYGSEIRPLEGIVTGPTLRRDGTILQEPGYDPQSRLLYIPSADFPAVPDAATRAEAESGAAQLVEVISDFPFKTIHDMSAWVSYVLTLAGRPAINGNVPLYAHTANCPAAGKSLLNDTASIIVTGRPAARRPYSPDDAEMRKAITAIAIESLASVLLDNVDTQLRGAALDAALTAPTWSDRVLGKSINTGELPLRTVWSATGNNLRFGTDLARRVLPVRLEAQVENPETRTGFQHSNLLAWVYQNRPRLAVAALTLLRAYFVAGLPEQPGGQWGSFEEWSRIVRGAIVWVGMPDPLITRETAKADDESASIVRSLVAGLIEMGEPLTAREIVDKLNRSPDAEYPAMRELCSEVATIRGNFDAQRLGYHLRKYRGRIASPSEANPAAYQVDGRTAGGGVMRWRAQRV